MPWHGPRTDAEMIQIRWSDQKHGRGHLTTEKSEDSPSLQSFQLLIYPSNTEVWSCENNVVFKEHNIHRICVILS